MFIAPKTTQDTFDICYNGKYYTIRHKNNKYYITINKQEFDISSFVDTNGDFLTTQLQTFITTIVSLTKQKIYKYYIEFCHIDDIEQRIQSKWFDSEEDAMKFFNDAFDYIAWDYETRLMYSEWDEENDAPIDIMVFKQL